MADNNFKTLQSILLDKDRSAAKRDDVLYEIHYRVPRRLPAPFMASHFVQIRRSPEDRYFERATDEVKKQFAYNGRLVGDLFRRTSSDWEALYEQNKTWMWNVLKEKKITPIPLEFESVEQFRIKADEILPAIQEAYREVLDQNPALFAFRAQEHVLDWIARRVTDKYADDVRLDIVFKDFCKGFLDIYKKSIEGILLNIREPASYDKEYESQDFGSVRYWLEAKPQEFIGSQQTFGKTFDDFRHYNLNIKKVPWNKGYPHEYLDHQLRWSRFPQAWNYTFIESPKLKLLNGGLTETDQKRLLTDFFLTAILDPSVVNSGYPLKAGQLGVGHVRCSAEFHHEFSHPSEDRPT